MKKQKWMTLIIIKMLMLLVAINLVPLYAQVVNYTEVNVFGWGQAMDGAIPAFCDLDGNGYIDLLVGTVSGTIWRLEQAAGDEFTIVDRNFSDINMGPQASPAVTNINNNGLIDLIIGSQNSVDWYEQQSVNSEIFELKAGSIISADIGRYRVPALADINNDGLLEMVVGQTDGQLFLFEQDSANAGTFSLIDSIWLDVDIGWDAKPFFTDLNEDDLLDLLVGEGFGKIFHFVQDEFNSLSFHQVSANFAGIDLGFHASLCVMDIDDDDKLDMFVGEFYSGVYHYEQTSSASTEWDLISDQVLGIHDFGYKTGFTVEDIDGDGLLDMLVNANKAEETNYIEHYEQEGPGSLNFILQDNQFNDIEIWQYYNLAIYDINGNDLLDLFVSDNLGYISRYEQDASGSYNFSLINEEFFYNYQIHSPHLTFSDVDHDSLIDMIIGSTSGLIRYYEQDSINAVTFSWTGIEPLLLPEQYATPQFTDIDNDGLLDMITGDNSGVLMHYEQDSIPSSHFSFVSDNFASVNYSTRIIPRFADVNNDGKTDMFIGDDFGGISLYLRNDDLDTTPPDVPANLSAMVDGNYVNLSWSACTAEDLSLYNIYRGVRNDTSVAEYLFSVDKDVNTFRDSSLTANGSYYYWLTALDNLGNESAFSAVDSVDITIVGISTSQQNRPDEFILYQNYPNPFNPTTTISYQIAKTSNVELSIYNALGQKLIVLVDKKQSAGTYYVKFDASNLSSGVYFYRLETEGRFIRTRKLVVLK